MPMHLGKLKEYRRRFHFTFYELAKFLNVSLQSLSNWVRGRTMSSLAIMIRIEEFVKEREQRFCACQNQEGPGPWRTAQDWEEDEKDRAEFQAIKEMVERNNGVSEDDEDRFALNETSRTPELRVGQVQESAKQNPIVELSIFEPMLAGLRDLRDAENLVGSLPVKDFVEAFSDTLWELVREPLLLWLAPIAGLRVEGDQIYLGSSPLSDPRKKHFWGIQNRDEPDGVAVKDNVNESDKKGNFGFFFSNDPIRGNFMKMVR